MYLFSHLATPLHKVAIAAKDRRKKREGIKEIVRNIQDASEATAQRRFWKVGELTKRIHFRVVYLRCHFI
jgi:hypothetical protein